MPNSVARRDRIGLAVVTLGLMGLFVYRRLGVEPRAWLALCSVAAPPLGCLPRAALLWMQNHYAWGAAALLLGLVAFRGAPLAVSVAALAIGAAAVMNYNATWGVLGAALGAWAWITREPAATP